MSLSNTRRVPATLTALPSRDLVLAAHQQVTRDWWSTRGAFELYVSQFVLDEASAGDAGAAARRVEALRDLGILDLTRDATLLAAELIRAGGLPVLALTLIRNPPDGSARILPFTK